MHEIAVASLPTCRAGCTSSVALRAAQGKSGESLKG